MVQQKELNLNQPLDANADPTIRRVPLEPELATAALTLHGDYYRQIQSKCNGKIVWHPVTQIYMWSILVGFAVYQYRELFEISDSWAEFGRLAMENKFILASYFPVLIFLAGTIGIVSFLITDEFKIVSDQLSSDAAMAKLFRFPLRMYANSSEAELKSPATAAFYEAAAQSTDFVEYRGSPIAVVTVVPLPNESTEDTFYAKITGLHVRKSYRRGGVEEDLLEFAKEKALTLAQKYATDLATKSKLKVVLVAEAYTVDPVLPALYTDNGFKVVGSSNNVNPYTDVKKSDTFLSVLPVQTLMSFLGVARVTYELDLGEAGVVSDKPKAKASKLRKRK